MSGPVRVLHVLGAMNRGGAETWLMHVLRHIDPGRFRLDFLVHSTEPGDYDDEVRTLGSKVIPCPDPHSPLAYAKKLRALLAERGPYDVVHSHVHYYSGWVLGAARDVGVPVRIAHSHSGSTSLGDGGGATRQIYLRIMRHLISRHATHGLAASGEAAVALWGPDWKSDPRIRILHCGIDLAPFKEAPDRAQVLLGLGIPADARVIGHVGSFTPAKNHQFLLDIAAEAIRSDLKVRFLLVGDGPLRAKAEEQALRLGIREHVFFARVRDDVPRLMMCAMDAFLFPSRFEGLPLAVVEAQAAGLPIILSASVTREVGIVPSLLTWLPLTESPGTWARKCLEGCRTRNGNMRPMALQEVGKSSFCIEVCIGRLKEIYTKALAGCTGTLLPYTVGEV